MQILIQICHKNAIICHKTRSARDCYGQKMKNVTKKCNRISDLHALEALYFKGLCIFCDKSAKFTKRLRKKFFYIYVLYRKFLHFCHTGKERRDFYAEVN